MTAVIARAACLAHPYAMRPGSAGVRLSALGAALLALTPALAPAQVSPPALKWQRGGCTTGGCQTGWYSSPAVADLDADGLPDVI